jgi:hypothetical protein
MGETVAPIRPTFNRSLRIEGRPERLTAEAGALLLREADERLGLTRDLAAKLQDPRRGAVSHTLPELLRTAVMLPALGWRDQDDADFLRHDAALRVAVSDGRGVTPLADGDDAGPGGLASQPTLSRLHEALSSEHNRTVLRSFLMEGAARRLKAGNGGHRQRYVTIDVDSFPIEVDGHQPGAEYNGHYGGSIFHPLIATAAELGDILDVKLRPGNVHTAEGGLDFILATVKAAREKLCQVAAVRIDAGFPDDGTLSGLEAEGIPYVARIKNNPVLDKMAEPYLKRPVGRPPAEGRTWAHELTYKAASWSKERRLVLVVHERPDELFLHHFWLVTSWTKDDMSADDLVPHYRQRGTAEGYFGELMDAIQPALSSNKRPKSHYRGRRLPQEKRKNLSFWTNEVRLVLAALAYNLAHAVRAVAETALGVGMTIRRVRDRFLRVASRFTLHARRVTVIVADDVRERWGALWRAMRSIDFAAVNR